MSGGEPSPSRLQELIRLLLDEAIGDEEFHELSQRLRGRPEAIDEYLAMVSLNADLEWEFLRAPIEFDGSVPQPRVADAPSHRSRSARTLLRRGGYVLAAVALGLLVAGLFLFPSRAGAGGSKPFIVQIVGQVALLHGDRTTSAAEAGRRIDHGDTVRTGGTDSFAVLAYDDGSRILVAGESSVAFAVQDGTKGVSVGRGVIAASIAPQPSGEALVLDTPLARIDVLGTEFSLAASTERTDVKVTEGRVKLTRSADGKSVMVAQGMRAAAQASDLVVQAAKPPPDAWTESFEAGLPSGWSPGEFVSDRLPKGSQGAVKAAPLIAGPTRQFGISSPSRWMDGLFVVHPDSHLNVTYRMDRPGWINIFFITRTENPADPTTFLHKFDQLPTPPAKAGVWRTASIPLSSFQRLTGDVFGDVPPRAGELAFGISWSAPEPDRGLVIDRVWVSRGGPNKVILEDVP